MAVERSIFAPFSGFFKPLQRHLIMLEVNALIFLELFTIRSIILMSKSSPPRYVSPFVDLTSIAFSVQVEHQATLHPSSTLASSFPSHAVLVIRCPALSHLSGVWMKGGVKEQRCGVWYIFYRKGGACYLLILSETMSDGLLKSIPYISKGAVGTVRQ